MAGRPRRITLSSRRSSPRRKKSSSNSGASSETSVTGLPKYLAPAFLFFFMTAPQAKGAINDHNFIRHSSGSRCGCWQRRLANASRLNHNLQRLVSMTQFRCGRWGLHACHSVQALPVRFVIRNRTLLLPARRRRAGLHPGAAAGLHRRRIPALQFGNTEYRPHHGLHDPQPGTAQPRLPGIFQIA